MREIKFRGKNLHDKFLRADGRYELPKGEWVYGNLIVDHNGKPIIDVQGYIDGAQFHHQCYVDADTVGEFTGLLDKNGKKIFEGDIITFERGRFSVDGVWKEYKVKRTVTFNGGRFNICDLSIVIDKIEIIGNIHDKT